MSLKMSFLALVKKTEQSMMKKMLTPFITCKIMTLKLWKTLRRMMMTPVLTLEMNLVKAMRTWCQYCQVNQ